MLLNQALDAPDSYDAVIGPLINNNRIMQMHRCVNVFNSAWIHSKSINNFHAKGIIMACREFCNGDGKSLVCVSRKQFEWNTGGNFLLIIEITLNLQTAADD